MNTYYWKINAVDCYALKDGLEKVAYNIHWSYFATDGINEAFIGGVSLVDNPLSENFIPFEQLTEQQVIDWFITELDIDNMKKNLDEQLSNLISPKIVTLQLTKPVEEEEEIVEEVVVAEDVPAAEEAAEEVAEEEHGA
jgi:hypothetical protein